MLDHKTACWLCQLDFAEKKYILIDVMPNWHKMETLPNGISSMRQLP